MKPGALLRFKPFNTLAPEVLVRLEECCQVIEIADGYEVIKQGERLDFLFGILSGSLKAVQLGADGNPLFAKKIALGQFVGWVSVFDEKPINATIIAQGEVDLVLIPSVVVKRLVLETPAFSEAVFAHLCELIRRLEAERMLLSLPNAFQRVYMHLYRLFLAKADASIPVVLPKQNEIAIHVNTSRETVSRAIQSLVKHGVLVKEGHALSVDSIDHLKKFAEHGCIENT